MNKTLQSLKKTMILAVAGLVFVGFNATVYADSFDDKINALKAVMATQQSQAANARAQANDYQSKITELQSQAAVLRTQMSISQAQYDKISANLAKAQADLAAKKVILRENVKIMYQEGNVTPLEMLASSGGFSQFIDRQQYLQNIKEKIQKSADAISDLKAQLEKQQKELAQILDDQKSRQQQIAASQSQINSLLAAAQQSAAAADDQVRASNSQIASLKSQQAAALAAQFSHSQTGYSGGGTCGGGYPGQLCNAAQDTVIDNWGMFNRECVSYTAFRVAASGRHMPYWGGRGNANQWVSSARSDNIPVDSNPHVGDVAISMAGPYGHAMYVEGVSGGMIHVSQYNYGNRGEYSTMTISASGLYFIHF